MIEGSRIFIAGAGGLLGSALIRRLDGLGYSLYAPSRKELDLRNDAVVRRFFADSRPEYVFLAAAKVGNINQNINYPVDFLTDNILIQQNVMKASHEFRVKRLLFYGSNCMYPRDCPQPMREEYLMAGPLEPTNRAYALAKLSGLELCRSYNHQYGTNFIVAIPASMYGENDSFNLNKAHIIPELLSKLLEAKKLISPRLIITRSRYLEREFVHVDDVADASIFLMSNANNGDDTPVFNVGTGIVTSLEALALLLARVVGFDGDISWEDNSVGGMSSKILDSTKIIEEGWNPSIDLETGIRRTLNWYAGVTL